eukprot:CAMPEP_0119010422 /NCGR_PEP_ID=MMETSP1176-20130426/5003_1 /TAXON_ID=265551 /ORGANISM="Synedropsis recta cf, Strain CCMP1620" /LENGTH=41 /DNA_ID= /DNA_START= /DNA_END= /DNA_ORIENTATION=
MMATQDHYRQQQQQQQPGRSTQIIRPRAVKAVAQSQHAVAF